MSDMERDRHIRYLLFCMSSIPSQFQSLDSNKMTLLYFTLSSLDLLGELGRVKNKKEIIDYVYSLQITPDKDNKDTNAANCGFRGSPFFGIPFNPECTPGKLYSHDQCHIAMAYAALLVLRILGDDFSRINKAAIIRALRQLQQKDGSFACVPGGSESDMRFVFTACAISTMLNDWSGVDKQKMFDYIVSSQSYDAGIAQGPYQESHGGSTYCAVAALHLMGRLGDLPRKEELVKWCLDRQTSGFQGRVNKVADTCYSFWIGATLHLLGFHTCVDYTSLQGHSIACQHKIGGFSKWPDNHPDPLHTYFALCGLSLCGAHNLAPIDCGLGLTERASAEWFECRRVPQYPV